MTRKRPNARQHGPSRHVYFVQSGDEFGPVKIGVTNNVAKRIELLQSGSPTKLRCIAVFYFGTEESAREAEAAFHNLFEDHRLVGEWFSWNDEFVDLLKGMLQIEKTFGPNGQKLTVSFEIVRLAHGGIRFRPRSPETRDAVKALSGVPEIKEHR